MPAARQNASESAFHITPFPPEECLSNARDVIYTLIYNRVYCSQEINRTHNPTSAENARKFSNIFKCKLIIKPEQRP